MSKKKDKHHKQKENSGIPKMLIRPMWDELNEIAESAMKPNISNNPGPLRQRDEYYSTVGPVADHVESDHHDRTLDEHFRRHSYGDGNDHVIALPSIVKYNIDRLGQKKPDPDKVYTETEYTIKIPAKLNEELARLGGEGLLSVKLETAVLSLLMDCRFAGNLAVAETVTLGEARRLELGMMEYSPQQRIVDGWPVNVFKQCARTGVSYNYGKPVDNLAAKHFPEYVTEVCRALNPAIKDDLTITTASVRVGRSDQIVVTVPPAVNMQLFFQHYFDKWELNDYAVKFKQTLLKEPKLLFYFLISSLGYVEPYSEPRVFELMGADGKFGLLGDDIERSISPIIIIDRVMAGLLTDQFKDVTFIGDLNCSMIINGASYNRE